MSFGLSGAVDRSQMLGADVAVAYMDGFRGYSTDYNISALSPVCTIIKYSSKSRNKLNVKYDNF